MRRIVSFVFFVFSSPMTIQFVRLAAGALTVLAGSLIASSWLAVAFAQERPAAEIYSQLGQEFTAAKAAYSASDVQQAVGKIEVCRRLVADLYAASDSAAQKAAVQRVYEPMAAAAAALAKQTDAPELAWPAWDDFIKSPSAAAVAPASAMPAPSPATTQPPAADPPATAANKGVSFSLEVAPILVESCSGCHVAARQVRGGLNMNTFDQLMAGGDSGPAVEPEDVSASYLIDKVRGTADGQRMPVGRAPLKEEQIALIERWISEGANFDGQATTMPLADVAQTAWIASASPEELKTRQREAAMAAWRRALPESQPTTASSDQILVLTDLDQAAADLVLKTSQAAADRVAKTLRISPPLFPAGATVFVLKSRYDYGEFGRMVESRELPQSWDSHYRRSGVANYVVLSGNADDADALSAKLQMQLASLWAAGGKGVPAWFADGVGRFIYRTASNPRDPLITQWGREADVAMTSLPKLEPLLKNEINEQDRGAIGYLVAQQLSDRTYRKSFDALVRGLAQGEEFEQLFTSLYGPVDATLSTILRRPVK